MSSVGASIQPTFVPVTAVNPIAGNIQQTAPSIISVGTQNNTLYIQNLNEKASVEMLKYDLTRIFSRYGQIESIVAKKNIRMRGQAFVIFDSSNSSKRALEAQQGRPLYGKPMVIRYAKFKSDLISKRDGTFQEEHAKIEQDRQKRLQDKAGQASRKHPFQSLLIGSGPSTSAEPSSVIDINRTLFVQSIPTDFAPDTLDKMFNQFAGFIEIRRVPGRVDLAFVDYETETQAFLAREATDRSEGTITVSFAKK